MAKIWFYGCIFALVTLSSCRGNAQELVLADNGNSEYKIVVPADASKVEQRTAAVLQDYVQRTSGARISITTEGAKLSTPAIYIGHTFKEKKIVSGKLPAEGSLVVTDGKDLVFCGGSGKGLI